MEFVLEKGKDSNIIIDYIFYDCVKICRSLSQNHDMTNWRLEQETKNIINLMQGVGIKGVEIIPRTWNLMADRIAAHGKHITSLSLFTREWACLNGS